MNLRRITALCGLLLFAVLPAQVSASSPPTWTEPVQIGAELPSSWFPDIHADAAGNVFTVYSAALIEGDTNEIDGLNGAVVISELGVSGWSEPADIAVMDGGIASRPMIVSDGQYAHLIYRTAAVGDPVLVVYSRAPLTSDLGDARSWSPPFNLSTEEAYWAQIGLLPDGGLLVVYNRISQVQVDGRSERRTGIVARRSDDQGETWGDEVRVAETEARVARTSMAIAPGSDDVIVVWDEGYDNLTAQGEPTAVASAVSEDGGMTWTNQQRFVEPAEQSTVATDGTTTVWLYRSVADSTLFFRTSDDGGRVWTDQQPVPNAQARPYSNPHNFDKLSAAFDGDGRLLFTWVGPNEEAPNGLSVMLATLAAGEWTEPQVLSSPVGFPEYPRIAVSLGNRVELIYFVRDKEFDIGAYAMWTMSAASDAEASQSTVFEPVYAPTEVAPTQVPVTIDQQPEAPGVTTPVSDVSGWDATPQATLTSPIVPILVVTVAGLLIVAIVRLTYLYLRDAGI